MQATSRITLPTLLLLPLMAACNGGPVHTASPSVRDSAGVEIVAYGQVDEAPVPEWRLAAEPRLSLGSMDGDPAASFSRIGGVRLLPGGRIVVVDVHVRELRWFDAATGAHLASAGGQGEGPGEFSFGPVLLSRGDSVLAWDASLDRLTRFDGAARLAGTTNLRLPPRSSAAGVTADGAILALTALEQRQDGEGRPAFGASLTVLERDGAVRSGASLQWSSVTLEQSAPPMFAPRAVAAPAADGWVTGAAREPELQVHDADGHLLRLLRWQERDRSVTPEHRAAVIEEVVSGSGPEADPRMRSTLEALPVMPLHPAYHALLPDGAGGFWVQRTMTPLDQDGVQWLAFDRQGRLAARIAVPSRPEFDVRQVGPDFLVAVERDSLDVERVAIYDLLK